MANAFDVAIDELDGKASEIQSQIHGLTKELENVKRLQLGGKALRRGKIDMIADYVDELGQDAKDRFAKFCNELRAGDNSSTFSKEPNALSAFTSSSNHAGKEQLEEFLREKGVIRHFIRHYHDKPLYWDVVWGYLGTILKLPPGPDEMDVDNVPP